MATNDNVRTREREAVRGMAQPKPKTLEADSTCPHCGAAVSSEYELCPECGWKLVDYCTFCGAPMSPEDIDCPECGMPADGIECPNCHTHNFRSFCIKCGQPISRAAKMAVEKAKKDPKVLETVRALQKIAELKAELRALDEEEGLEAEPEEPTEGELRLRALMAKVGFTAAEAPKPAAKVRTGRSREEILAEYRKAVDDANRSLEEMLPPAGSTPQEQRNYYTARKVAITEIVCETFWGIDPEDTMGWMCNHCQIMHDDPSQCKFKDCGGEWTKCEDWKMWTVVDEGTEGAVEVHRYVEKRSYIRQ